MNSNKEEKADVYTFARESEENDLYAQLPDFSESLSDVPVLTKEQLGAKKHLRYYPETEIRYLVSEFEGNDPESIFLVPQRTDFVWEMLEEQLLTAKPLTVLLSVPMFWQMGPMFYHTCRRNGVPVSVMSPRNLPLGRQLIKEVGIDMVVATPEAAAELQALLTEEDMEDQIRAWHLVVPFGYVDTLPTLPGTISLEYHLFPGMPVARATILDGKVDSIEPHKDYSFELSEEGTCLITSLEKHALPLIRFDTDVHVRQDDASHIMYV